MSDSPRVRFCTSPDGTSLGYTIAGKGPALLQSAYFDNLLEYSTANAMWRRWTAELSRNRTHVRYDARGFGMSERKPREIRFDALVADLGAVADAAGLERFALIGHSSAGAIAVAYAALNPGRVTRLMVCSSYARGRAKRDASKAGAEEVLLYQSLAQFGWSSPDSAFRQVFQTQFMPDAPAEAHRAIEEMQLAMPAENVLGQMRMMAEFDISELAPRVSCPTVVVHSRGDLRVPVEEASYLARLIPDSRLVLLPTRNRILWEEEPAWEQFAGEVRAFLPSGPDEEGPFLELTARERQLVELLARGLDNHQIAAHLDLSEKTVRNMVSSVFDKLGVESRAQAIVRAREAGFGGGGAA